MVYPDKNIDRKKFVSDAEKVYAKIKSEYEPDLIGKFLAIDPKTEKVYLADTSIEVLDKAKEAQPDSFFFIKKIGYEAVGSLTGLYFKNRQNDLKNG